MCKEIDHYATFACGHEELEEQQIEPLNGCFGCDIIVLIEATHTRSRRDPCHDCINAGRWVFYGEKWHTAANAGRLRERDRVMRQERQDRAAREREEERVRREEEMAKAKKADRERDEERARRGKEKPRRKRSRSRSRGKGVAGSSK